MAVETRHDGFRAYYCFPERRFEKMYAIEWLNLKSILPPQQTGAPEPSNDTIGDGV